LLAAYSEGILVQLSSLLLHCKVKDQRSESTPAMGRDDYCHPSRDKQTHQSPLGHLPNCGVPTEARWDWES